MATKLKVRSEPPVEYIDPGIAAENKVIADALAILEARSRKDSFLVSGPAGLMDWLRLKHHDAEREIFGLVLLDTRHKVIDVVELFFGTIDSATVHAREVVKAVLAKNAARVVLFHNHPSGNPEPSAADELLTKSLVNALALIDAKVLDHIVVGREGAVSFSERGLL